MLKRHRRCEKDRGLAWPGLGGLETRVRDTTAKGGRRGGRHLQSQVCGLRAFNLELVVGGGETRRARQRVAEALVVLKEQRKKKKTTHRTRRRRARGCRGRVGRWLQPSGCEARDELRQGNLGTQRKGRPAARESRRAGPRWLKEKMAGREVAA